MQQIRLGTLPSYRDKPSIPMAKPIPEAETAVEEFPLAEFPMRPTLKPGCYRMSYQPNRGLIHFAGTLRLERTGGTTTASGDLYRAKGVIGHVPVPIGGGFARSLGIPIYPINAYYSYLKVTGLKVVSKSITAIGSVEITADEYVYTPPPAGAYSGTFPAFATRTVVLVLKPDAAPAGFTGAYFTGKLYVGGVDKGAVALGWVSSFYRRATVEIDTLTGSVSPAPVPALVGGGMEDFKTVYATAGWDVKAIYDQVGIPVPAGVAHPNACWSDANLHALMLANRSATADLDKDWRAHLLIVPGAMGCSRGVMYDSIGVPREGAAAYSDDGYPAAESAWFGLAANQQAHNVPRAFMRTAVHEIGHVFNLIHQFFAGEGGSDNSVMTTTPEVADVLQGPATGAPGIFPDNIALGFNAHCRNDLIHFPDIVVRPGGISFLGGSHAGIPEADFDALDGDLELRMEPASPRLLLGEPVRVEWSLTNKSKAALKVPSDINPRAQHAFLSVLNPAGELRIAPSFAIATETVHLVGLKPGDSVRGKTRLFWSTNGFAFERPGRHAVNLELLWGVGSAAFGLKASREVWVDYPVAARDNDMAASLLNPDVGLYVALGGTPHVGAALDSLRRAKELTSEAADAGPTALRGFDEILPER